jgi:hypothetical protein
MSKESVGKDLDLQGEAGSLILMAATGSVFDFSLDLGGSVGLDTRGEFVICDVGLDPLGKCDVGLDPLGKCDVGLDPLGKCDVGLDTVGDCVASIVGLNFLGDCVACVRGLGAIGRLVGGIEGGECVGGAFFSLVDGWEVPVG